MGSSSYDGRGGAVRTGAADHRSPSASLGHIARAGRSAGTATLGGYDYATRKRILESNAAELYNLRF